MGDIGPAIRVAVELHAPADTVGLGRPTIPLGNPVAPNVAADGHSQNTTMAARRQSSHTEEG